MKSNVELLKEYKALLDAEIITQEEFEAKKAALLSQPEAKEEPAANQAAPVYMAPSAPEPNAGWGVLGAFFPLVGLILFLVWNSSRPQDAKYAGVGALIGVGVGVLLGMLVACTIDPYYYY